jgi:DNA-directed RNA polymerase specialized sigma24 family protein
MGRELSLAEIGRQYPNLAPQLERVLGRHLAAPPGVIEEACQLAWGLLIAHRETVDADRALSWLATAARREAAEHDPLDPLDPVTELPVGISQPDPADVVELRDRLARVAELSARQQRLVWLRGLGYGYREISLRTGDSPQTIERQLVSARRRLRAADSQAAA